LDINPRKRITDAGARREKRIRIEGRKPKEESLVIPLIRVLFPKTAYIMQPEKGLENLFWRLSSMNINTLEENNVKGFAKKTEFGKKG